MCLHVIPRSFVADPPTNQGEAGLGQTKRSCGLSCRIQWPVHKEYPPCPFRPARCSWLVNFFLSQASGAGSTLETGDFETGSSPSNLKVRSVFYPFPRRPCWQTKNLLSMRIPLNEFCQTYRY